MIESGFMDEEGYPGVREALRMYRESGHGLLVRKAAERLKKFGYRILCCEGFPELRDVSDDELRFKIAPKLGYSYGELIRHDVVAEKNGKLVVVEVKFGESVARQIAEAEKKGKVILVLPVKDGKKIEVWGFKELGIETSK